LNQRYVQGISPDAENRDKDDFYPTPPDGTQKLLAVESFRGSIWEPACGDGAMSRELEAAGFDVLSTDLIDRGYGTSGIDFLMYSQTRANNIITNPPFKHAEEFARLALERCDCKVALLCRLSWLEGSKRRKFFTETPFARVWVFSKRLRIQRARQAQKSDNSGMIAFAWFVWEHGHEGPATIGWI